MKKNKLYFLFILSFLIVLCGVFILGIYLIPQLIFILGLFIYVFNYNPIEIDNINKLNSLILLKKNEVENEKNSFKYGIMLFILSFVITGYIDVYNITNKFNELLNNNLEITINIIYFLIITIGFQFFFSRAKIEYINDKIINKYENTND